MNSALWRPPLVPHVDRAAPLQFLRTAYDSDDWIALFLKRYDTGEAIQRVGPVTLFQQPKVQAWLRLMNALQFHIIFVSVNALLAGRRSRTREAVCAIRHVFIDVDHDGRGVLAAISARRDLPTPSYAIGASVPGFVVAFLLTSAFVWLGSARAAARARREPLVRPD